MPEENFFFHVLKEKEEIPNQEFAFQYFTRGREKRGWLKIRRKNTRIR